MQRTVAARVFDTVVWIVAAAAVCYLLVGAYYGYAVGRAIREAKASNPLIAVVAHAIGRENAEEYAIAKSRIPSYVVKAPTFWIALRLNE